MVQGPFSLQEFGNLVALALDAGSFSESFLTELDSELESEPHSDPSFGSCGPELATATIAHTSEQSNTINRRETDKKKGRHQDSQGVPKEKQDWCAGGFPPSPVYLSSPLFSLHPPAVFSMNYSASANTGASAGTASGARRSEDRGKSAVGPRFLLDKIKRHVLRAAPTPDFTYSTKTHCTTAPTVFAQQQQCQPAHTSIKSVRISTSASACGTASQNDPDPSPTSAPGDLCTSSHPYSHSTLLSGFFDFNDEEDQEDDDDAFIPYSPLASQYERARFAEERRARENEQNTRREKERGRERPPRLVPSLAHPPPSPSRSVSTTASSHAPITPTTPLFFSSTPAYSHSVSDSSSDSDSYSYSLAYDSFPLPPGREFVPSVYSDAHSSTNMSGSGGSGVSSHYPTSHYTTSSSNPSSSLSGSSSSHSSSSSTHSSPNSNADSSPNSLHPSRSHAQLRSSSSSKSSYPQLVDHPFARSQDDPFAKASVQIITHSTPVSGSKSRNSSSSRPRRGIDGERRRSLSRTRTGPRNPPPARPLPPPPTESESVESGSGAGLGSGTGEDVDPTVVDEWTLYLGASSLPSLPSTLPCTQSPTTTTTKSKTRRSSPPSSYLAPSVPKLSRQRSKRKPSPLHLGTGPVAAVSGVVSKEGKGGEDWTLSLPFVRSPTHTHTHAPPSWYAPEAPPSPPARFQRAHAHTHTQPPVEHISISTNIARPRGASTSSTSSASGSGYGSSIYATPLASPTCTSAKILKAPQTKCLKPPRTADSGRSALSATSSTSTSSSTPTIVPGAAQRQRMGLGEGASEVQVQAQVQVREVQNEVELEDEMDAESMISGTYYSARSSLALTG